MILLQWDAPFLIWAQPNFKEEGAHFSNLLQLNPNWLPWFSKHCRPTIF